MTPNAVFPPEVFGLWQAIVALTAVVFAPLAVYWLHSLFRTAASVRSYAREGLAAARHIETNTAAVPALDKTIGIATGVLSAAESAAHKLDAIATVLEVRAGRR